MRRKIGVLVVALMIVLNISSVFAETNHLMWNIEWGHEPKEIVSILKEEKGITAEITMDKSVMGMQFSLVETPDDANITILGYPVKLMWRWMIDAEQVECQFDKTSNTDDCYSTIINAMRDNFGNPTKIILRIYSEGYSAWSEKTADNIYDVVDLTGMELSAIDFKQELSKYSYINENTYATLDVCFDNVECKYTLNGGVYSVSTSYGNGQYVEDYMQYPDPTHEEYKLTQYNDTGF